MQKVNGRLVDTWSRDEPDWRSGCALLGLIFFAGLVIGFIMGMNSAPRSAPVTTPQSGAQDTYAVSDADVTTPIEPSASPEPSPAQTSGGIASPLQGVHGLATWYCCTRHHPSGLYAAAGPALRVGNWRGRVVTVSSSGGTVRVTLIDFCACGHGRVIDLYPQAFRQLAPLSQGVVGVTVSWSVRLPATDTEAR